MFLGKILKKEKIQINNVNLIAWVLQISTTNRMSEDNN